MNTTFTRSLLLSAFVALIALQANAQVSGRVYVNDNQSFPFCNVALIRVHDSSMVSTSTTDSAGIYVLPIAGNDIVMVLAFYPGYGKKYSIPFFVSDKNASYKVDDIKLEGTSLFLKGVQVSAEKPFIEHQLDKTIYNIENSIIAAGNNVLEVLKKLPGITVDINNNIAVMGKGGVMVLIDGRTSYMSAEDLANYLKSINASQIEKIEVITNPSAKYDAAGKAVINIIFKKDKNIGFNGEVTTGAEQGFYGGLHEGINMNYKLKHWNFFGSYSYSYNKSLNYNLLTYGFLNNDVIQNEFISNNVRTFTEQDNSERAGVDFTPTDKQTIGFVFDGSQMNSVLNKTYVNSMYTGAASQLDSTMILNGHRNHLTNNLSYDMYYNWKIDSAGKELNADMEYDNFTQHFRELDITNYYATDGTLLHSPTNLLFFLPINVSVIAAKIDYTQPLGKKGKLDLGLKASTVSTANIADYKNVVDNVYYVDTTKTNNFSYTENIYAGYANYSYKASSKLFLQTGLRGEETQSKGVQIVHDTTFTRSYFNLFPSALVNYKLDSNNTLNLSYSRRISRPDYHSLNPFILVINPYTFDEGNPDLLPTIVNILEASLSLGRYVNITAGYSFQNNVISQVTYENAKTFVSYDIPENLSNANTYYTLWTITIPVSTWFTSMNTINGWRDDYYGELQGADFSNIHYSWYANSLNTFALKKGWSAELSFQYASLRIEGINLYQPFYTVDAGIKKRFAKDRGTVSFNVSDIFQSENQNYTEQYLNTNFTEDFHRDSRRVHLTLTWKLGRSEFERQEKQKAAADEMNRVK